MAGEPLTSAQAAAAAVLTAVRDFASAQLGKLQGELKPIAEKQMDLEARLKKLEDADDR